MPIPAATTSKATLRKSVASLPIVDDWWPESLTGDGNAGGTTAIFSSLVGYPRSSFVNHYLLLTSGTYAGQWRIISDFAPATGTVTVATAFGGKVLSGVTVEFHQFRPDLYDLAVNRALALTYPNGAPIAYRPVLHHTFVTDGAQKHYATPYNMRTVYKVSQDHHGSQLLRDYFDRSNSATAPGSLWTVSSGTWGITSKSLYAPGDTNGDQLLAASNPQVRNGVLQATLRGDTTAANFRVLGLMFRYEDSSNYLVVRLVAGTVDLRKVDAGSESSLTTGTVTTTENVDYVVRVMFEGAWIRVWVDNVEYITYELLGLNLKYLGANESGTWTYGNVGFRLDKTGSPDLAATATLAREYYLHQLVGIVEIRDWDQSYDGRGIELFTRGNGGLAEGRVLWFEGMAPLSAVAENTTFGTIASDTTAVVEIQTADPAYQVIAAYAGAYLLQQPGDGADHRQQAAAALADAERLKRTFAMPLPRIRTKHL